MTTKPKSRTPAKSRKRSRVTIPDPPPPEMINQALADLGVNVPFYHCRLVRNRLEFHLYGGQRVTWTPPLEGGGEGEG